MKSLQSKSIMKMTIFLGVLLFLSACQVQEEGSGSSQLEQALPGAVESQSKNAGYSPIGNNVKVHLKDI